MNQIRNGKELAVYSDHQFAQQVEVIDLMHYWKVLRRHMMKIAALTVVVTLIAILVALRLTPVYKATSTLLIESEEAKIVSIEEVYGLSDGSDEYFQTQFEILKSRELAKYVVLQHNLINVPEYNPYHPANKKGFSIRDAIFGEAPPPTDSDILAKTVNAFWHNVEVSPVRKTQLVKVSVNSESPERARLLADAMTQAYITSQLEAKVGATQQAAGWLQDRLGGLKDRLQESERRLQEYRDQNDLVDVAGVNTLVAKEIDQITESLVKARTQRLELATAYSQLKRMDEQSYENLSRMPVILSHPLVSKLRESETLAELKVSELSKRYGVQHPKMIAAHSELEAVRESILLQMRRIAAGIEHDYLSSKENEAALESALIKAKQEAKVINRSEFTLNEYLREVQSNRALYETFFNRISETSVTGDLQTANARISDPAVTPLEPAKPNKKLIVVLAFAVSLMLGVALAFLFDLLDATIKNIEDVDRKLGQDVLGALPIYGGKKSKKGKEEEKAMVRAFLKDEEHNFSESVRTIRTSLTLTGLETPSSVILITSSLPGEGKTTLSCNLASAFGQMERTLLIDADMRRPTVAKKLGLLPYVPGLSNAVSEPERLDECIQTLPDLGFDVLSSGPLPPNPLELLGSMAFRKMLNDMRERYDRIIIDSAPMHVVSDALYLSTLVDGVAYVVKADSTREPVIKAGLERLDDSSCRLLGVILNQVDVTRESKYGNYNYGYYDSYGYTDRKA